jgi:DNA-directed RNA polymerase subunit K/omega
MTTFETRSEQVMRRRALIEERFMMVSRPPRLKAYEFAVVSALRAHQLMGGCRPRLDGHHKATTMAQMEVADGKVARLVQLQRPGIGPH